MQDLTNSRAEAIEAGWRVGGVGPHKPSGPPAEIHVADTSENSLDTEREAMWRNAWNISHDRDARTGYNMWNRASRRKR